MNPVCVRCKVEFKVAQIGVTVCEMAGDKPYKLWAADLMGCPGCGAQIVARFAEKPFAQHFEADFQEKLDAAKMVIYDYEHVQVKDEEEAPF